MQTLIINKSISENFLCYFTTHAVKILMGFTLSEDIKCKDNIPGVKVPSTSSLSVYTKVLAHNLNDIRNWASLIGLLLRICWCLLSVFLIYCSDEWKKLVNLISSAFSDEF